MKNKYQINKEKTIQEAIEWQNSFQNNNFSYLEIANKQEYFAKKS